MPRRSPSVRLSQQDKHRIDTSGDRLKSITEFLSDAIDNLKAADFVEAVGRALPWAGVVAEGAVETAADILPPLKFLVRVYKKLGTVNDPERLGHLACTLAFQRAVERALAAVGGPADPAQASQEATRQLGLLEPSETVDLGDFTLERALEHAFFKRAEAQLDAVLRLVGYGQDQAARTSNEVKDRFVPTLKELLSNRETGEKFAPFREYLELGAADEKRSYRALAEHLEYQHWLFDEAPVLGGSPFALRHVDADTECGELTWGDISPASTPARAGAAGEPDGVRPKNPFSERDGGRRPLLDTVMERITDGGTREPIVIQAMAGAGKSAFTLRLCMELQRRQLRPILVRLKDVRLDLHAADALPQAVRLSDEQRSPDGAPPTPENLFRGGAIFGEAGPGELTGICRYVLVLDGWDEISVANEGFRQRVERLLEQVRREYVDNATRPLPVKLVITGRPSADVNESGFLRDRTPVLTIRPLSPSQLRKFVADLSRAVRERPVAPAGNELWPRSFEVEPFEPVFESYEAEFRPELQAEHFPGGPAAGGGPGVLGLPLLAQLAARLVSSWPGDPRELVGRSTTLYRNLVNLTCRKAGKDEAGRDDSEEIRRQARVAGAELRKLLWETAAAMTVYGEDLIPYDELALRLGLEEGGLDRQVAQTAGKATLSALLISFYFKGGFRHAGCEFAHKSFREYLFAEAVVECLKEYGRRAPDFLPERERYWEDFSEDDPRHELSRSLARLVAPRWITNEVGRYLNDLLEWEVKRAAGGREPEAGSTAELPTEGWRRVRNGLADLWDWWGEGAHLRPQPTRGSRKELVYREPFALELIQHSLPFDPAATPPGPTRTTTVDAHLGEALFRLCVSLHRQPTLSDVAANPDEVRKYQFRDARAHVRFAPSLPHPRYFRAYAQRIACAGLRPSGDFPRARDLGWIALPYADLSAMVFEEAILDGAILDGADLNRAILVRASLDGASLDGAYLSRAYLVRASLVRASLVRATLNGATLDNADLFDASLDGVNLDDASLFGASR